MPIIDPPPGGYPSWNKSQPLSQSLWDRNTINPNFQPSLFNTFTSFGSTMAQPIVFGSTMASFRIKPVTWTLLQSLAETLDCFAPEEAAKLKTGSLLKEDVQKKIIEDLPELMDYLATSSSSDTKITNLLLTIVPKDCWAEALSRASEVTANFWASMMRDNSAPPIC